MRLSALICSKKHFLAYLFAEENLKLPPLREDRKYKKQHDLTNIIIFVKAELSLAYLIFHSSYDDLNVLLCLKKLEE